MISFLLLFISLIPLAILGSLTKKAYDRGLRLRVSILAVTLIHELILVVFPVWYSVFTGYWLEYVEMIIHPKPIDLFVIIIGEIIFIMLFSVGIQIGQQKAVRYNQAPVLSKDREQLFLFLMVGVGIPIYLSQFMGAPITFQDFITHGEIQHYSSFSARLFAWFKGFFQVPSLMAASLILVDSKRKHPYMRLMALSVLALICLSSLSEKREEGHHYNYHT